MPAKSCRHNPRLLLILAALLAAVAFTATLIWAAPAPVRAASTLIVNTAADVADGSCSDGTCSLRDAIALAAPGDVINFDANYTIYLSSTLSLSRTVTIDGSGHTIIVSGDTDHDGTGDVQVFNVAASGVVTLTHLNVVKGLSYTSRGAGLYNAGALTVQDCTFAGNHTQSDGGAIYNSGAFAVTNSTFSSNIGTMGGGLCNDGQMTISNSTFANNSSSLAGAGLFNSGTLAVTNSTFSGNQSALAAVGSTTGAP